MRPLPRALVVGLLASAAAAAPAAPSTCPVPVVPAVPPWPPLLPASSARPSAGSADAAPGPAAAARVAAEPGTAAAPGPAAAAPAERVELQRSLVLRAPAGGDAADALPLFLRADRLRGRPDLDVAADGAVELRRGGLTLRADTLAYDAPTDTALARGNVRISRAGAVYRGQELSLALQRVEGYFLAPTYEFATLGAGGRAERIDFLGPDASRATEATYTSCVRDGSAEPAWQLQARRVSFDLETSEGYAEGARLRFLGATILAWPALSFPLSDARKSGWLPPTVSVDNRSGVQLEVPYYWNLAPNRDATLTPRLVTRRGLALDGEFRYLEPHLGGVLAVDWLPRDRLAGASRHGLAWSHTQRLPASWLLDVEVLRVSDDAWWKDFDPVARTLSARLLPARLALQRPFALGAAGQGLAYLRLAGWQPLQDAASPFDSPYQREPQLGAQLRGGRGGFEWAGETEYNRFTLPDAAGPTARSGGDRWHLLASVARPWRDGGSWFVPQLSLNAAAYGARDTLPAAAPQQPARGARAIPTFSVDAGVELERPLRAFGRDLRQTLEPRLHYVNTPYRDQSGLPNYDAAAKDFNGVSIFSDNAFSGIDRVSDSHQVTAGATTRLVDVASGSEVMRLGLAQRYLLRPQRVAPQADGTPDGPPLTQRFSDLLLVGSTSVIPRWTLNATVQYSPEVGRSVRTITGVTYSPGPWRTVSAGYRFTRGLSEQVDVGWQWPLWGAVPAAGASSGGGDGRCGGAWYSVGRVSYSLKDRRATDSLLGVEYDAGCWIGRLVATQTSTGPSQATTRLMLQLELVGLSRLGANPLKVLKDNIPGYRLLREERGSASSPSADRLTVSPFYE